MAWIIMTDAGLLFKATDYRDKNYYFGGSADRVKVACFATRKAAINYAKKCKQSSKEGSIPIRFTETLEVDLSKDPPKHRNVFGMEGKK